MRRAIATAVGFAVVLTTLVTPAAAQYPAEARLVGAKQLAGAVLRALERCLQNRGAGASCSVADVGAQAGVNPATGASANGQWIVVPWTSLTLSSGAPPARTGLIAITGVAGRDTAGLALSLHVTPGGPVMRCEMRSGTPPGLSGGEPC